VKPSQFDPTCRITFITNSDSMMNVIRQNATQAVPIPIKKSGSDSSSKLVNNKVSNLISSSVPNAPVIGSLPAPKIGPDMPNLALPPSSPQAFSLVSKMNGSEWEMMSRSTYLIFTYYS
jgi:hypothetical protein